MVPANDRGSKAARCLEKAWRMLRRLQPCLPPVVFVILASGGRKKLGHFADCVWRTPGEDGGHEVAISPALFDCPEDLLATKRRMPCSLKRGSMPGVAVTDITIGRNFSRLAANSALSVNSTTDDTDGAGRAGQMQECLRSTIRC